jgi:hypothetical protein
MHYLMDYSTLLDTSRAIPLIAAFGQVMLAFLPKFSPVPLGSAILLSTVVAPTMIDRLALGTQVGGYLLLANCIYLGVLVARWNKVGGSAGVSLLVGLFGCVAFGYHVLVFAAIP